MNSRSLVVIALAVAIFVAALVYFKIKAPAPVRPNAALVTVANSIEPEPSGQKATATPAPATPRIEPPAPKITTTPTSGSVNIRLIWAKGKDPISSATALLVSLDDDGTTPTCISRGVSGKNGEVSLRHPASLAQARLMVQHADSAPAERLLSLPWPGRLVIELDKQGVIHGVVVSEMGQRPIEGATVDLFHGNPILKNPGKMDQGSPPFMRMVSNGNGEFSFKNLGSGTYRLTAIKGNERSYLRESDVPTITLLPQETAGPYTLVLKMGAVLMGSVTDKMTGKPIAEAHVDKLAAPAADKPMLMSEMRGTLTDKQGLYTLEGLPFETIKVHASAKGYARQWIWAALNQPITTCNIALDPAGTVKVKVVDENKNSIPQARVRLQYLGLGIVLDQVTDEKGLVVYENVSRLASLLLSASKAGYRKPVELTAMDKLQGRSDSILTPVRFNNTETTIVVVLELRRLNGGLFRGKVVDGKNAPVSMAHVRARLTGYELTGGRLQETVTDPQGEYQLAVESAGDRYLLSAQAEGSGLGPDLKPEEQAGTPENPKEVNFTLKGGHWLKGQVADREGKPVEGAKVTAAVLSSAAGFDSVVEGMRQDAMTDAQGKFGFKELPAEDLNLRIAKAGYMDIRRSSCPVDQEMHFVMNRDRTVVGRVIDGLSGQPLSSFIVITSLIGEVRIQQQYSPDGTFNLTDNNPNLLRGDIVIKVEGYAPTIRRDIVPNLREQAQEIVFPMKRGTPLVGQVVDGGTGKPLANTPVIYGFYDGRRVIHLNSLLSISANHVESTLTNPNGEFRFLEGDEPGTLIVMTGGFESRVVLPPERGALMNDGKLCIPLKAGQDGPDGLYRSPDRVRAMEALAKKMKAKKGR